jgi:HSP20 family molecular chaperone IbpA
LLSLIHPTTAFCFTPSIIVRSENAFLNDCFYRTTSPKTDEKIQQSSQSFQGNVKPPPGAKFSETTATAIHTDWYESETEYHIAARFLVGIDTSNMHLYVEKGNIVIEATRDIKARNESTADPISKRTSLFLRRTIEIPPDADLTKISSKLVGDTIVISIPKI